MKQDADALVLQMKMSTALLCAFGVICSLFMIKYNWVYCLLTLAAIILYCVYSFYEIDDNYKKGKYTFVYGRCTNREVSDSDISNKLPSKKKSYDYTFTSETESGEMVDFIVNPGKNGVKYNVGTMYILAFRTNMDDSLESRYFVAGKSVAENETETNQSAPVTFKATDTNASTDADIAQLPEISQMPNGEEEAKASNVIHFSNFTEHKN